MQSEERLFTIAENNYRFGLLTVDLAFVDYFSS